MRGVWAAPIRAGVPPFLSSSCPPVLRTPCCAYATRTLRIRYAVPLLLSSCPLRPAVYTASAPWVQASGSLGGVATPGYPGSSGGPTSGGSLRRAARAGPIGPFWPEFRVFGRFAGASPSTRARPRGPKIGSISAKSGWYPEILGFSRRQAHFWHVLRPRIFVPFPLAAHTLHTDTYILVCPSVALGT